MYSTPMSVVPIWVASRMRCASPPDSVWLVRLIGQVVEPDVDEEAEARPDLLEHLVGDRPLALRDPARERLRPTSSASVIDRSATSEMSRPSTVTPSASGRRRLPLQAGQGRSTMYFSSSVLMYSESVSR